MQRCGCHAVAQHLQARQQAGPPAVRDTPAKQVWRGPRPHAGASATAGARAARLQRASCARAHMSGCQLVARETTARCHRHRRRACGNTKGAAQSRLQVVLGGSRRGRAAIGVRLIGGGLRCGRRRGCSPGSRGRRRRRRAACVCGARVHAALCRTGGRVPAAHPVHGWLARRHYAPGSRRIGAGLRVRAWRTVHGPRLSMTAP